MKHKPSLQVITLFLLSLSYVTSTSEICNKPEDCQLYNHCINGKCKHDSLLPITLMDVIGFVCILIASAISNAGGIGGGTLFLPVIILIMHFYTHEAIPISKIVIFFGALASFALNLQLEHPGRKKSLALDFNIIILIVPNLLFGTMLGVTMNKMLPSIIIVVCLTLILIYNTYKTVSLGIKQYRLENEYNVFNDDEKGEDNDKGKNKGIDSAKKAIEMTEQNDNNNINSNNKANSNRFILNKDKLYETAIENELSADSKILRLNKLIYIFLPFILMAVLSIIRESPLIEKCSFWYWTLFVIYLLIGTIFHILAIRHVQSEYANRCSIGFPYDTHDIKWTMNKCINLGFLGLLSGFIAGTIGIGGGVILGPILLSLGIYPIVSIVTTNFLVLLTSSSTSLQFMLSHMLNYEYSCINVLFSLLGSYMGTKLVHYLFKRSRRESILVFALVIVIGASALILPITSVISTIYDMKKNINPFAFNSPCGHS